MDEFILIYCLIQGLFGTTSFHVFFPLNSRTHTCWTKIRGALTQNRPAAVPASSSMILPPEPAFSPAAA